jgi:hypothetical protein
MRRDRVDVDVEKGVGQAGSSNGKGRTEHPECASLENLAPFACGMAPSRIRCRSKICSAWDEIFFEVWNCLHLLVPGTHTHTPPSRVSFVCSLEAVHRARNSGQTYRARSQPSSQPARQNQNQNNTQVLTMKVSKLGLHHWARQSPISQSLSIPWF